MVTVKKKNNILVIRLSAIGDVAMTVPVLWSYSKSFPESTITFVSQQFATHFIYHIPGVNFIEADIKGRHAGFFGIIRLFFNLKKRGDWDVIIDLHDVIRTKVLRCLFLIFGYKVVKIDKGRKEKYELTRISNKKLKQLDHTILRYKNAFLKAGFDFDIQFDYIFSKAQLTEKITGITGFKQQKWIGIAPMAKHKGKIYPIQYMEKVITELTKNSDNKIFLIGGGQEEKEMLESWEKKFPNTLSLAHKLSLYEELKVFSNMDILVTMDSANMHLASLVNTPVVSIWGATHPYAGFYGWNQNPNHAVQIDLPCRPCSIYGNKPCFRKDYACLNNISPDVVINKINSIIVR